MGDRGTARLQDCTTARHFFSFNSHSIVKPPMTPKANDAKQMTAQPNDNK